MTENELKQTLKSDVDVIDGALKRYMRRSDNLQSPIYEAMEYSLFAGGKRLRPVLMTECAKMCGGDINEILPFACAMEMIHTYSLIHDDLPAMDNDDLRRGKPTNHIKYGEATAILAGDALLNKAFEIMTEYGGGAKNALKAINIIAKSSGTEGMIGGQVIDILSEGKSIDLDTLKYLHSMKTGAIIRSSCVCGALLSGEEDTASVDVFALNLGIAFQIRDDILDVIGTEAQLGKPIGSDEEENKTTYVTLLGLQKAEELVKSYSRAAKDALAPYGKKADFLLALTDYLVNREK
ncbi:MAG: polyprenyl synthetase family protein [Firmicutes bacterium]|nr:polyprenyl synthetase family protein [Bacillota bacterium]